MGVVNSGDWWGRTWDQIKDSASEAVVNHVNGSLFTSEPDPEPAPTQPTSISSNIDWQKMGVYVGAAGVIVGVLSLMGRR